MKRPIGILILAIALVLLALAGLGNAFIAMSQPGWVPLATVVISLAYGVAALVASVGLWKNQKWAYLVFLVWVGMAIASAITAQFLFVLAPWPKAIAFLLFIIAASVMLLVMFVKLPYQRSNQPLKLNVERRFDCLGRADSTGGCNTLETA
jgi:uncharacterized membrane protein (DUF2068 family)